LPTEAPAHAARSRIEPLAPARYRVEFTASDELKHKLGRVADLMRHSNPSGELSVIVERALDLLLAKLEKERLAKSTRAREASPPRNKRRGYVARSVRREVFERDGERCTFFDESGRRCESRTWLELDHRIARARGGADDASNLQVRCRAHNRLAAEQLFGREHMERAAARRPGENAGRAAVAGESQPGADAPCGRVDEAGAANHPRWRVNDEVVVRALRGLGFQAREARRAVAIVGQRRAGARPPRSRASFVRHSPYWLAESRAPSPRRARPAVGWLLCPTPGLLLPLELPSPRSRKVCQAPGSSCYPSSWSRMSARSRTSPNGRFFNREKRSLDEAASRRLCVLKAPGPVS
jgi:5-methylcytosine-specific restriction endonuclease McrA